MAPFPSLVHNSLSKLEGIRTSPAYREALSNDSNHEKCMSCGFAIIVQVPVNVLEYSTGMVTFRPSRYCWTTVPTIPAFPISYGVQMPCKCWGGEYLSLVLGSQNSESTSLAISSKHEFKFSLATSCREAKWWNRAQSITGSFPLLQMKRLLPIPNRLQPSAAIGRRLLFERKLAEEGLLLQVKENMIVIEEK